MAARQYDTVSSCTQVEHGYLDPNQWQVVSSSRGNKATTGNTSLIPCTYTPDNVVLKLNVPNPRNNRQRGFQWMFQNFHPDLKLPRQPSSLSSAGMVGCCFQAKARESLLVGFTPTLPRESGAPQRRTTMWQVEFGSDGNTRTTLQCSGFRQLPRQSASQLGRIFPSTSEQQGWKSLWVCWNLRNGTLYAGIGDIPGEQCVALLDTYKASEPASDHPSAKEGKGEAEGQHTSDSSEKGPTTSTAKDDLDTTTTAVTATATTKSADAPSSAIPTSANASYYVGFGNGGGDIRSMASMASVRHIRVFALPDTLQAHLEAITLDSLVKTSASKDDEARTDALSDARMLEEYQKECDKQRARAKKFGLEYKEPPLTSVANWSDVKRLQLNPNDGFATGIDLLSPTQIAKQQARQKRFGIVTKETEPETSSTTTAPTTANGRGREPVVVNVVEAWDNDDRAHQHRIDPPRNLWKAHATTGEDDDDDVLDEDNPATAVPEKIHLFGIDWTFKQMRNDDILSYFQDYGPSYVEWLGDLSCNVLFQDKFSAARALHNLSHELLSPPPVLGQAPATTVDAAAAETTGTSSATTTDTATRTTAVDRSEDDLGRMGWRLGMTVLRKISNDRFGRQGSFCRVLLRVATSLDVLQQRPTSWPKPPPWFSTDRVLVPKRHHQPRGIKRRGRDDDRQEDESGVGLSEWNPLSGDEHPLLSRGLTASRGDEDGGRARKKPKRF